MSIVPVAPVVNVPSVPYPFVPPPFTDVSPLTYRDGTTYLEYLRGLNNWIQTVLIPYIADNLTALDNDYLDVANNLINTVNTALTTQTANINTALTTQQTNVNNALAAMQTSVDQAVTNVENSAITVQDPVVEGILTNINSASRIALNGIFGSLSDVQALDTLTATGRLAQTSLDSAYGKLSDVQALDSLTANGRLSSATVDATYGGVLSVMAYGAKADGITDDTAALQAAVNAASASGKQLTINGHLKITAPIVLPSNVKPLTITSGFGRDPYGAIANGVGTIESTGSAVFSAADTNPVVLNLSGINFRNTAAVSASLFSAVSLKDSVIRDITATAYDYIFDNSSLSVTHVDSCHLQSVGVAISNAAINDSAFTSNYLDGNPTKNSTCFKGPVGTTVFTANYFDFFKYVFDIVSGYVDVRIIGNIFDYCWRAIGTSTSAFLQALIVTGNTFTHMRQTDCSSYFTAPDADMQASPWVVIDSVIGINKSIITNNLFLEAETAIKIRGSSVTALRISGNVFNQALAIVRADYSVDYGGSAFEGHDIYVESMENQRVTALPAPSLAANGMQTYDLHKVIYNGKHVWNDAGVWKDVNGTAV